MLRIDSHQHFWKFDPVRDSWINDEMSAIRRDFMPIDLAPILKSNNINGCIAVQADQSEAENEFLLEQAAANDFIKGIVGWVDLQSGRVEERLEYYSNFEKIKGFRHVLQGEADRALMLKPAFMNGISALGKFGYTYDVLIFPDQLGYTNAFVQSFPNQKFVIDHIAKPRIIDNEIEGWKDDIKKVAKHENVYCKISGMVTEASYTGWKMDDFIPYLDVVVKAFGTKRIMFGSDWPVCVVAAPYEKMLGIVQNYFSSFSREEQDMFFGGNAERFYGL